MDLKIKLIEAKNKLKDFIERERERETVLSFSGGKDSTVCLGLVEQIGYKNKVKICFFDTGLELDATYDFVKKKISEGGNIEGIKPQKPFGLVRKECGIPVHSKLGSEKFMHIQKCLPNFNGKDDVKKSFNELMEKYNDGGKHKAAFRGLCNRERQCCPTYLKNNIERDGLNFNISNKCCYYLKKQPAKLYDIENGIKAKIMGIRQSEGGVRAVKYKGCMEKQGDMKLFFPLFGITNEELEIIIKENNIELSRAYTLYGLSRTGCTMCPYGFGQDQKTYEVIKKYEPKKYNMAMILFGESYKLMDRNYKKDKKNNQISLFGENNGN